MATVAELLQEFAEFEGSHRTKVFQGSSGTFEFMFCGSGQKTMLFFHGLAGSAHSVYRFVRSLENEFKIVCPTIPAFSGSIQDLCAEFENLLHANEISPSIVVGGSFGGMVAQAFWFRNSSKIDRVVLFDTLPPNEVVGRRNRRLSALMEWLPWSLMKPLFRARMTKLFRVSRPLSTDEVNLLDFSKEQFLERFRKLDREVLTSHSQLAFDFMINTRVPTLAHWPGRLTVICAQDDVSGNAEAMFKSAYPFARLVLLDDAGHLGSLLYFDRYIREIKDIAY